MAENNANVPEGANRAVNGAGGDNHRDDAGRAYPGKTTEETERYLENVNFTRAMARWVSSADEEQAPPEPKKVSY
jgi:hypothetical protein